MLSGPGIDAFNWSPSAVAESGGSYVGLFMGTGLEKSPLFYGGYNSTYMYEGVGGLGTSEYRMDLAWVDINGLMLILSLIAILQFTNGEDVKQAAVSSSSSSSSSAASSSLDTNAFTADGTPSAPACALVFATFDHSMIGERAKVLQRQFVRRQIKEYLKTEAENRAYQQAKATRSFAADARRVLGVVLTLVVTGASTGIVAYMILNEQVRVRLEAVMCDV
jgi:hypothetical protein